MPIQLLITNIGFAFSIIISLGLGILVFIRRPRDNAILNKIFMVFSIVLSTWLTSYVLGINLHDPDQSRIAFMFNLSALYLAITSVHLILAVTDRLKFQAYIIKILYGIATGFVIFYTLFPQTFMLASSSRLYLPNFLVPGPLYYLQDFFFFGVSIYLFVQLAIAYHKSDYSTRNRLKYFFVAFIYGYIISLTPEFLLYGIPVDPMPAAFMGLYSIPMAYAILKYEVIDINLLAKRALGYGASITGVTMLILFTGYANTQIHLSIPSFPQWLLPLASAVIAVIVGILVWNKVKEVTILKYQFVDVVTHKFRTPLTYIRWSLDTLRTKDHSPDEEEKALDAISDAHVRLSELTDSLIGLSRSDDSQFLYTYTAEKIDNLLTEVIESSDRHSKEKQVVVENMVAKDFPLVYIDRKKMIFALQMVIDNAVTYSQPGGAVRIMAEAKSGYAFLSVEDKGIGIAEKDLKRLFTKFFRTKDAISMHTEGLGIGIYLARDILKRQGGDLMVESAGLGKGSTFTFKIPLAR